MPKGVLPDGSGQAANSISANSTFIWGPGNINADPQFIGVSATNYRVATTSPCIDAGTNIAAYATNFTLAVTNDFDGLPRPLDANGNGRVAYDIGERETSAGLPIFDFRFSIADW